MSLRNARSAHFMRVSRISAGRSNALALSEGFGYFILVCQRLGTPSEALEMSGRNMDVTRAAETGAREPHRNVPKDETERDEAAIENAWRVSGDLHIIADRLANCAGVPAWVHKALLDLANASVDMKPYARQARSLVRYAAVREAHDHEGLSWEKAKARAVERLRGQPAEATAGTMWGDYKRVRKALRAAGVPDDDPGYRWVDLPDKSPG
jgi:hypothetical protein